MRKLSIAVLCVASVFASQACFAAHGLRFDLGRRNTTVEQFQHDRDMCVAKVIASSRHSSLVDRRRYCQSSQWDVSPVTMDPPPTDFHGYRNRSEGRPDRYFFADDLFIECMRAKGYTRVPESSGFRAGPLWQ